VESSVEFMQEVIKLEITAQIKDEGADEMA
jgi:hypothetical protein